MTADILLKYLNQILLFMLAVFTTAGWLRRRDITSFNVALAFFVLAISAVGDTLAGFLPPEAAGTIAIINNAAVLFQPYAAVRIAKSFTRIPVAIEVVAVVGYLLSFGALFALTSSPVPALSILLAYFTIANSYIVLKFAISAVRQRGILRTRLVNSSVGLGLFGVVFVSAYLVVFLFAIGVSLDGQALAVAATVLQAIGLVSAVLLLLGFAPPRWLRRLWTYRELFNYLNWAAARAKEVGGSDLLIKQFTSAVDRMLGSSDELTIEFDGEVLVGVQGNLFQPSDNDRESFKEFAKLSGVHVVTQFDKLPASLETWRVNTLAKTLYFIPLKGASPRWYLLVVPIPRSPLFVEDELDVLSLLAQHASADLDTEIELSNLQGRNLNLEEVVGERDRDLANINKELRRTALFLQETNSLAQVGGWEVDVATMEGQWSAEMFRIFEINSLTAPSVENFARFFDPESAARFSDAVDELIAGGDSFDITVPLSVAGGRKKWIRILGKSEKMLGKVVMLRGATQDVTEKELQLRELSAVNEKLRVNNRELEDFAYVASHDLQEPLRKVQAFGDRLKTSLGERLDVKQAEYLERMLSAASRMQKLINDLLSYSRVTSKPNPPTAVDLQRLAESVVSDLEVRIESTKARVTLRDLPVIYADRVQLKQVLQNLMSNALKFQLEGAVPEVEVSAKLHDEVCELSVKDNGIGFDEQYIPKLFTPFQRLHGRNEYEGTGIGLAIVRKIVERHRGTIRVKSSPGRGSEFTIILPIGSPDPEGRDTEGTAHDPLAPTAPAAIRGIMEEGNEQAQ